MIDYEIIPIDHSKAKPFLLYRHYARRIPAMSYSFGLLLDGTIVGVCVFGSPANKSSNTIAGFRGIELVRLFVEEGCIKNTTSWFLSRCLKMLPSNIMVVSYADPHNNHHGYIYQATNWYYTGQGQRKDGGWDSGVTSFIDNATGKQIHARSFGIKFGACTSENAIKNGFIRVFTKPKHKYFFFTGKHKEDAYKKLGLKKMPYPKGDNIRYDTGSFPKNETTNDLFNGIA
jgi:hypothetical protein